MPFIQNLTINYATFMLFNFILSTVIVLLENKNPTVALAWLFFLNLFPGIGFLFYILLSQNILKRKVNKYTKEEQNLYHKILDAQRVSFSKGDFHFKDPALKEFTDIILFHNKLSESFFSQNNKITPYFNGVEKFAALLGDLEKAKHHIHLLYYIAKSDNLNQQLINLLIRKAEEGLTIRFLIDHVGGRKLSRKDIRRMKKAGIQLSFFFPSKIKYININANYRNHRKIVVIDGVIGYIGGINVGDEYINQSKRFGYWRDTHLRLIGDSVLALQLRFLLDWRNASHENVPVSPDYLPIVNPPYHAGIQIVSSGPDDINEQIKQGYIKLINKAKNYIYIQTPYFIPDESIKEALKIATVSGVDVRIMIPNKPDHPFVNPASVSYCGELLAYGVRAFTYEKGFLHAKTIIVDDTLASVGSCNFDIRSFRLNFESNAFIYDQQTSTHLRQAFEHDLLSCREITFTDYCHRSTFFRFKESLSRLFSPIL